MAVAVDAVGTTANTPIPPFDYTGLTIGAGLSNSALVVCVMLDAAATNYASATNTATWDNGGTNQAMTRIGIIGDPANGAFIEYWGLLSPTAGNKTLHYTSSSASITQTVINAISLTGVVQTNIATAMPTAHFSSVSLNNTSAPTFAVTSASGNMVFGAQANIAASDADPLTSPAGATEWIHDTSVAVNGECYHAAGAGTVTFTFTAPSPAQNYCGAGIDVVAAAGTIRAATLTLTSGTFQTVTRTVG
jgi:hypothetical protein